MRLFYTLGLLLTLTTTAHTQNWLQPHHRWTFHVKSFWSGNEGYFRLLIDGDTTVQGQVCRRIRMVDSPVGNFIHFAYATDDAVYDYLPQQQTFTKLYDLSLGVGDTVTVADYFGSPQPRVRYRITAVGDTLLAGQQLRYQDVTFMTNGTPYHARIIEGMGMTNLPGTVFRCSYFFLDLGFPCQSFIDGPDFYFSCFASGFGVYSPDNETCLGVVSSHEPTVLSPRLWPNPTRDILHLAWPDAVPFSGLKCRLTNAYGQLIRRYDQRPDELPLADLPAGTYFFCFEMPDGRQYTTRVVKL